VGRGRETEALDELNDKDGEKERQRQTQYWVKGCGGARERGGAVVEECTARRVEERKRDCVT